jgi:hypothetical protein
MNILDQNNITKLTRIYVAITMMRQVAQRVVEDKEASSSMLKLVDVTSGLLEEIMDVEGRTFAPISDTTEIEMIM